MLKKIYLCAIDENLADTFDATFSGHEHVTVVRKSILELGVIGIVSPANSFGFMDGGLDAAYENKWPGLQNRIQSKIKRYHGGELVVGTALWEHLPSTSFYPGGYPLPPITKYVIVAPTMRVPMRLPPDTVNPYLAARAAFRLAVELNLDSLAVPGMGTGVGGVSPEICARQIKQAVDDCANQHKFPSSWHEASRRHQLLYRSEVKELQATD